MIVDLHTHLVDYERHFGPRLRADLARCGIPPQTWTYTQEEYLEKTAAADRVVVFGLRARRTGWHTDNAYVSDFVRRHSSKYVFFTSVDPLDEDCMEQLRRDHREGGAKGVKLGPIYQGLHPLDEAYRNIYAYCQREGLPIMTHMATTFSSGVPLEYARPMLMDRVACEYPELKIVMAHLGHPWEGECIAAIRHQPNLYADLSALYYRPLQFYRAMMLVQEYGAWEKVFFGSDFPATTTADSLAGVRNVNRVVEGAGLPLVKLEKIEEIIHRDSLAVLGIDEGRQPL